MRTDEPALLQRKLPYLSRLGCPERRCIGLTMFVDGESLVCRTSVVAQMGIVKLVVPLEARQIEAVDRDAEAADGKSASFFMSIS
jgi:hypothetical protein